MNWVALGLLLLLKVFYIPLNRMPSRYYFRLPVDDRIPLIPVFLIPYLLYHVFEYIGILLVFPTTYGLPLLVSLCIAYGISETIWFIWPNGVKRPDILSDSILHRGLAILYRVDHDSNAFPSAHVFVTVICTHYWSLAFPVWGVMLWTGAWIIIISTVCTKQHYILDIAGGFAAAYVAIYFTTIMRTAGII